MGRVCITGFGLVSPMGSTPLEIWGRLHEPRPWTATHDNARFAPYLYHPERAFETAAYIENRTQARAMGRAQLNSTVAAAQALRSAGLEEDRETLARTDLFVACGGGDNDVESDEGILNSSPPPDDLEAFLNERLMSQRPSLYLNQLPNLFAANICICLGVVGNSLTFIGDEAAGLNAMHIAYQKVRSGESDVMLVGGVSEGGRRHFLEPYIAKEELLEHQYVEIWDRTKGEVCFGNGAGFVVLESESHARRRGAEVKCRLAGLEMSYASRTVATAAAATDQLLRNMSCARSEFAQVLTCSHVERALLADEEAFWSERTRNYQNTTNVLGGMLEAGLSINLALGALCLQNASTLPPVSSRHERAGRQQNPQQLLVSCWGRRRGEAVALLEACQ